MKFKPEIQEWIDAARLDLEAAELLSEKKERFNKLVVYHSQQCIEKYLKAYCIHFNLPIQKTHSLEILIKSLLIYDHKLHEFLEDAISLSDLAFNSRYPDDFEDWKTDDGDKSIFLANKIETYLNTIIEPTE